MWIRKHERDRRKGVDSPLPSQMVSTEEFIPRRQYPAQRLRNSLQQRPRYPAIVQPPPRRNRLRRVPGCFDRRSCGCSKLTYLLHATSNECLRRTPPAALALERHAAVANRHSSIRRV
jgi:hypothetical protein